MNAFIARCGGPSKAARLLRVDYTGGLAKWLNGTRPIPGYIQASIDAHMMLPEKKFKKLLEKA